MKNWIAILSVVTSILVVVPVEAEATSKEDLYALSEAYEAYFRGDYSDARLLYRALANKGNAEAQYFIGVMYQNGMGVPWSHAEAVKWYRLAAEQGYWGAQMNLGSLYYESDQLQQDLVRSLAWLILATEQGAADWVFELRGEVASHMTPDQMLEAQLLARKWRPRQ